MLQNGNLTIDFHRAKIFLNDREIFLTMMEYKFLLLLANNIGDAVSRDEIMKEMQLGMNNLSNLVSRIRHKIGKDFIQTQRNMGTYLMPYIQVDPAE
ncbi:hypothetical protein LCGC14_0805370 [marine sediment metagenome]|uniref:OmpR/PhoB-type domain-containing protein n=1 Tax=marine sediment metagenome TaxID=412755 RepID=A0A0F9Q8E7_9ZZZZ